MDFIGVVSRCGAPVQLGFWKPIVGVFFSTLTLHSTYIVSLGVTTGSSDTHLESL
jgi:hypothetical protein